MDASADSYRDVLRDFESRMAAVDEEIGGLRERIAKLNGEREKLKLVIDALREGQTDRDGAAAAPLPYADMTLGEAAVAFLRERGQPAQTNEIVAALEAGGARSKSKDPYMSMFGVLSRAPEVMKSRVNPTTWGLKEWLEKPT